MKEITKEIKDYLLSVGYPDKEKIFYLEVWLWLWREKKICINCNLDKYNLIPQWWCNNEDGINYNTPNFDGPEEAIANAIEYLVENNYIK